MPIDSPGYSGWEDKSVQEPEASAGKLAGNDLGSDVHSWGFWQVAELTRPWWVDEAEQPLGQPRHILPRELDELISAALAHSPFIQSVQLELQVLAAKTAGEYQTPTWIHSAFNERSSISYNRSTIVIAELATDSSP